MNTAKVFFVALADQESFRNGPTTSLNRPLIFNNKKVPYLLGEVQSSRENRSERRLLA